MIVLNDVLGYPLKIYQDSELFKFSLDSSYLPFFASIRKKDKYILDIGCGNGIISMLLSLRCDKKIDAVEIQKEQFDLANKSIKYNKLEDRINLINMDVRDYCIKENSCKYDLILCNPPYFKVSNTNLINNNIVKSKSRHEVDTSLEDIVKCASYLLNNGGNFSISNRCDRLIEIIELFRKYNIEPKRIQFIFDNVNKKSKMVFIEGQKCGRVGLIVEKPFILHKIDGSNTQEYDKFIGGEMIEKTN